MLSFRLSEDQYHALQRLSVSVGARSVSDYARDALFGLLRPRETGGVSMTEARVDGLAAQVQVLGRDLEQLRVLVESKLGAM